MEFKNYNVYFFFALLIGVSVLVYFLFQPFLISFIIAVVFAQLFYFAYRFFLKITGNRKGLSSALTCLLIALIIIIPLFLVSTLVVSEVRGIIDDFSAGGGGIGETIGHINAKFSKIPYIGNLGTKNLINPDSAASLISGVSRNTLSIIQSTYRSIGHFVFVSFIMFFSLFYLFIDGERFLKIIMKISPLKDRYETMLAEKFSSIARSTIKGTSLIAIIQGFIGSILFLATGVTSPVLLGILMTISSVIPTVGSGLIWVPVGLVMLILGHTAKGVIILAVGALIIGSVDNILRQKLIGKDAQMHPLLILFSTLGGITLFGITGFIVGPMIMALFIALWEIYFFEFKGQLEEFNK